MNFKNPQHVGLIIINCMLCFFLTVNVLTTRRTTPAIESAPVQPDIQAPISPSGLETITADNCRDIIGWLSHDDREGRMSGKRGNVNAADYIKEKFENFGLQTSLQKIPIKRMNPGPKNEIGDDFTHNIIGILPGKTDNQIIIGGHMDHIGYGPKMSRYRGELAIHNGADDNATGTAAVLELAEAFATLPEKPNHTLVFICFSAEEMGLIGSKYYVEHLNREERSKIDLMVNFDMIGWLKEKKTIKLAGIDPIVELQEIIGQIGDRYPFKVVSGGAGSGGSDHASFGNAGIPFVYFHTGLHEHYHKPSDDLETIDINGVQNIIQFAFEMIKEFDDTKVVRMVSIAYPPLNDMTLDHGHGGEAFPIESKNNE